MAAPGRAVTVTLADEIDAESLKRLRGAVGRAVVDDDQPVDEGQRAPHHIRDRGPFVIDGNDGRHGLPRLLGRCAQGRPPTSSSGARIAGSLPRR